MAIDSTELTDAEIIAKCKNGDRDAFQLLVERYQRRAFGIAYGMLRNREDALDAAQDAFVKVFVMFSRSKEIVLFTWFYRIVVNVCIDRCRKAKRRKTVEYDDTFRRRDESFAAVPLVGNTRPLHPGVALEVDELGTVLKEAFAKLSENHRTILLLREVEGMSYEDIADTMDCHLGTVMSRLHHARKNLQKVLKPYMDDSGLFLGDKVGAEEKESKMTERQDELLNKFVDGVLSESETVEFNEMTAADPELASLQEDFSKIGPLLRGDIERELEHIDFSSFAAGVSARLNQELPVPSAVLNEANSSVVSTTSKSIREIGLGERLVAWFGSQWKPLALGAAAATAVAFFAVGIETSKPSSDDTLIGTEMADSSNSTGTSIPGEAPEAGQNATAMTAGAVVVDAVSFEGPKTVLVKYASSGGRRHSDLAT